MQRIFVLFLLIPFIFSCTVMTIEQYRSADTMGGLGHFRIGIGVQSAQLIGTPSDSVLTDIGIGMPSVKAFAGIGLLNNLDIFGSVSLNLPLSIDYGIGLKLKYFDKLGFKGAIVPNIKYSTGEGSAASVAYSYKLMGGELPFTFTYSVINLILITAGIHGGYYIYEYTSNGNIINHSFFTYGVLIMPEIKFGLLRISLGVDIRDYYSKTPILYSGNYSALRVNTHPFLSISLQF